MAKQEIEVAGAKKQVTITPFEHHTKYHETDLQGIRRRQNEFDGADGSFI